MRLNNDVEAAERVPAEVPDGTLVGIADAELRVLLASPLMGSLLGVPSALEGGNLRDLIADPESVRRVEMLVRGVVTEAVLATLGNGQRLVGELANVRGGRWVHLHVRKAEAPTSSIQTRRLAGRASELALLKEFILDDSDALLFLEGSLGIGKTTLLAAFEALCNDLGCLNFRLDARAILPNDTAILGALYPPPHGASSVASLFPAALRLAGRRWVLMIDNFDVWTKSSAIPKDLFVQLPPQCRIVVAARRRPGPSWWGDAARPIASISLAPLAPADALQMARMLEIDVKARAEEVRRTQGHPLCIAALTRTHTSNAEREAHALDLLASTVAGGVSLDVLKLSALPVRITEDLLAELLDDDATAATVYDALSEVCIRDPENVGLRMPESLREVLHERLRRRNPVRFSTLQLRLAQYYAKRLDDGATAYAPTVVQDLLDTLRLHPVLGRMFGGADSEGIALRRVRNDEGGAIDAAARRMADAETAADIGARMEAGTCTTYVLEQDEAIVGVVQFAIVTANNPASPDGGDRRRAAVQSVLARYGEGVVHAATALAFVVPPEEVVGWGPVSRAVARLLFSLFNTSRAISAWVIVADPLRPPRSLPGAETVIVDGFLVTMQDVRARTPLSHVTTLMSSSEEWLSSVFEPPSQLPLAITTDAVRAALASLDQLDQLASSPLVSLDLAAGATPAHQLQNALRETLMALNESPLDRKHFVILDAVYRQKLGKHEQIAAEFGIPYGTFRRHLTRALERVRELLTQRVSRRSTSLTPK